MDVMYLVHGVSNLPTTHFQTRRLPISFGTTGLPVVSETVFAREQCDRLQRQGIGSLSLFFMNSCMSCQQLLREL